MRASSRLTASGFVAPAPPPSLSGLLCTQDAMRHESPLTTRGYVATTAPAATAAMDRLSAQIEGRRRRGRRAPARTGEVTRARANS